MLRIHGNILEPSVDVDAVCITTNLQCRKNGTAVMGAGLALAAHKKWNLHTTLGLFLQQGYKGTTIIKSLARPFSSNPSPHAMLSIIALPTKDDWRNNSTPELIIKSMGELCELADANVWQQVWVPSLGTNNGGLSKTLVWPLMETMLDNRFFLILPQSR